MPTYGDRPRFQRLCVLAIVTYVSKGRVPMRSTGSIEQPIELLSGLTMGAFRLDAKQREAKVGDLREWSITSLAKVANLRERLLIFATGRFIG